MERNILEAALARIASDSLKNELLLRGSFLTSHWVGSEVRKCDDLDFLALSPLPETEDLKAIFDQFCRSFRSALGQTIDDGVTFFTDRIESEIIFEESPSPGLRLKVPFRFDNKSVAYSSILQIDLGFNDPLPEPQLTITFQFATGAIEFRSVTPELAMGWKLHGLVEREGLVWRAKDLADLWLIQDRFSFDTTKLRSAIQIAFASRDAPLWRLDRLLQRQLGKSSGSRRRYSRFLADFTDGGRGYPDKLSELVEDVAQVVKPVIDKLKEEYQQKTGQPYPNPFAPPLNPRRDRILAVCDNSYFKTYCDRNATVIVRERIDPKSIPCHHAATFDRHRGLLLQSEARGITFNSNGRIIARPYRQFGKKLTLDNIKRQNQHAIDPNSWADALVLEKLDGSLVFSTAGNFTSGGWYLRTRRGTSEISDRAMAFAKMQDEIEGCGYQELVDRFVSQNRTVIFEWCSRSRWIVLDHPQDRLVLTGIRDNQTGMLLEFEAMQAVANQFRVECVKQLTKPESLQELVEQTLLLTESEGCILRLKDHRQFKIKSRRYDWLHRAVEGCDRDRARWYLWASGAEEKLLYCSKGRGIDLESYVRALSDAVTEVAQSIWDIVSPFADEPKSESRCDRKEARKQLALHLVSKSNLKKRLAFLAFDGACLESAIRQIIVRNCEGGSFRTLTDEIKGPLWND